MRCQFRVHPAGAALLAAAFVFADSAAAIASLAALCWHEGAHVAAMALCKVKSCQVELTPFGGMAYAKDFEKLGPLRQFCIAGAGAAASGAGAALCLWALPHTAFTYCLFGANIALALWNCLPVWPLDGARMLVALLTPLGWGRGCQKVLTAFGYVLGAGLVALGLYGAWHGAFHPGLLLLGPYLWYAARWGGLAERLRRVGEKRSPFQRRDMLPVRAMACMAGREERALSRIALWPQEERYSLLLVIDEETGRVRRVITEGQAYNRLFGAEALEDIAGPQK